MDLEILFWLLIILAPVLGRLLKGKRSPPKKAPRPAPMREPGRTLGDRRSKSEPRRTSDEPEPSPSREPGRALSPFEEALREIQEALAEAREEQQAQRARAPAPAPPPSPPARPERPPESERSVLFKPGPKPEPPKARTPPTPIPKPVAAPPPEIEPSFYDEAFESSALYEETFHEEVHSHVPPSDIEPGRTRKKVDRSKWRSAFVMHEIIDRPRSMKRWKPRLPGDE